MTPESFQEGIIGENEEVLEQSRWRRLPIDTVITFMRKIQIGLTNGTKMTAKEMTKIARLELKKYQIQNIKPFDMMDYNLGKLQPISHLFF